MNIFENTTKEQEILITLGIILTIIAAYIISFTHIEANVVSFLFGDHPHLIFKFVASFIFKIILSLIIAIPMLSSLCYCSQDNFIKGRFC